MAVDLQFGYPLVVAALPIVSLVIFLIVFVKFSKGPRLLARRLILSFTFAIMCALLLFALADPFVVDNRPLAHPSQVTVLFDKSASMLPYKITEQDITARLEGVVPYKVVAFGDEYSTPLMRSLLSAAKPYSTILIVSDGQDTVHEQEYKDIAERLVQINASLHVLNISLDRDERSIKLNGPQTSIAGIENTYTVVLGGAGPYNQVNIYLDDQIIFQAGQEDNLQFKHKFTEEGVYKFRAELITDRDAISANNVFYKTTRIIPKPPVLYVGSDAQVRSFLEQFTKVTAVSSLPSDLSPYVAVVMQNQDSATFKNIEVLQDFVVGGNGLVVLGGDKAFEHSRYDGTALSPLLPVTTGKSSGLNRAAVILVVDVSASAGSLEFSEFSTNKISEVQRLLAWDFINSISGENLVGVIAFYQEPYLVQSLQPLGANRNMILDKIRRLAFDKAGTQINQGLQAAWEMLEPVNGARNVVIISDGKSGGNNDAAKSLEVAAAMGADGVKIHSIGVGLDAVQQRGIMPQLASESGGIFVEPAEREGLKALFGQADDFEETVNPHIGLQIVDPDHAITRGIGELSVVHSAMNNVIPRQNARMLAVTANGDPAVVTWRYGLGRVTTVSTFTGREQLGTLLAPPDSRFLARIVSYAVGDPEKKLPPSLRIDDTTIGKNARVTATGLVPEIAELSFSSIEPELHISYFSVNQTGIQERFGTSFAVSYPEELQQVGIDPRLEVLSQISGGKTFRLESLGDIEHDLKDTTQIREVQAFQFQWMALLAAAVIFLILLFVRKIEEMRR